LLNVKLICIMHAPPCRVHGSNNCRCRRQAHSSICCLCLLASALPPSLTVGINWAVDDCCRAEQQHKLFRLRRTAHRVCLAKSC
jgi:hypothetical protein